MALSAGSTLGPYEILSPLGAGGMGEVYRARDTRLGRTVAIKVLPEHVAADPDRRQRFQREARAISGLNHPHICTLHDVGHHDGIDFLVMEYVDGETLAARLATGPLPIAQALAYGVEIAEALDKAHHQGIVHRDLKPGNVMLTKGGVKLLDFGLAKLRADSPLMDASTRTIPLDAAQGPRTGEGTIVGTLQYMAPEQLEGKEADARADIFAFGAVLYEMLTGRRAFEGTSQASVISAIMSSDPPALGALQPLTPPALDRVIRTCLSKDRDDRWASMHDVLLQLTWIAQDKSVGARAANAGSNGRRALLPWAVAAIAVIAAAILWASNLNRSTNPDVRVHFLSVLPPRGTSLATEEAPAISPDGRRLAFVAHDATGRRLLYTRPLDDATAARPLADTEGASLPFWSPNSQSIGFFGQGKLKRIDVATGRLQTLADSGGARGGAWNQANVIVFVPQPNDGPYQVSAEGGEATLVPMDTGGGRRGWFPSFLPDGRHFLVWAGEPSQPENSAVYLASLDSSKRTRLVTSRSNAIYAAPGYLFFWRDATLLAQPFDERKLELGGNPVPVATAVGLNFLTNQSLFSVSNSGTLVFFAGAVGQSELVWVDRGGRRLGKPGPTAAINCLSLSPDATRVVYDEADSRTGLMDLWQLDFARGVPSRLTFHPNHDFFPLWSPDGTRIAFGSLREPPPQLYMLDANSAGNEKLLLRTPFPKSPSGWSRDGELLIYSVTDPKNSGDIWALPLVGKREPYPLVNTTVDERYGTLSPDGRWLAYISNETGTYEVYVQALSGSGVRRQVSTRGGFQPHWRRDGQELFYIAPDRTLMAMDFRSSAATFETGPPNALFATRTRWIEIQAGTRNYAAAPDGQRFLVANATDEAQSAPITVVLNWIATLGK